MTQPLRKGDPSVAYGVKWHKLERPGPWKPTEAGAEIVGYYLGQSLRDGQFGQYYVVMLAVPTGDGYSRPFTISGTAILSKIDAGQVEEGQLIRVTFQGLKDLGNDRRVKLFDVYVGEGRLDDQTAILLFEKMEDEDYGDGQIPGRRPRLCGICRKPGHNRARCPNKESR